MNSRPLHMSNAPPWEVVAGATHSGRSYSFEVVEVRKWPPLFTILFVAAFNGLVWIALAGALVR